MEVPENFAFGPDKFLIILAVSSSYLDLFNCAIMNYICMSYTIWNYLFITPIFQFTLIHFLNDMIQQICTSPFLFNNKQMVDPLAGTKVVTSKSEGFK